MAERVRVARDLDEGPDGEWVVRTSTPTCLGVSEWHVVRFFKLIWISTSVIVKTPSSDYTRILGQCAESPRPGQTLLPAAVRTFLRKWKDSSLMHGDGDDTTHSHFGRGPNERSMMHDNYTLRARSHYKRTWVKLCWISEVTPRIFIQWHFINQRE